jgi:hypothetical protein
LRHGLGAEREKQGFSPLKKQQLPMKKALFPLETRFFSFSIRIATGDASFSLVSVQPKKEINHGNCKEGSGQESSGKEGRSRKEGGGSCEEGSTGQEGCCSC